MQGLRHGYAHVIDIVPTVLDLLNAQAPATLGGQVQSMFDNSPSTLPHVQSQKMRGLAVASPRRVQGMESLPAISEAVRGFESTAWFGIVAPSRTPDAVVAVLNRSIDNALRQPDVKEKMAASGVDLLRLGLFIPLFALSIKRPPDFLRPRRCPFCSFNQRSTIGGPSGSRWATRPGWDTAC